MAEFYSYLTNRNILATPLTPNEALYRMRRICQMPHVSLLSTPPNLFDIWMDLLETNPVINGQIFDLIHVVIMLSHGIRKIYTFNIDDFIHCNQIEVINPNSL